MTPEELTTRTDTVGGTTVVALQGEVDLVTSVELRHVLHDALESSPDLTVDFTGLTFIDSSGLSALVDAHRRARDVGGVLTLRHPTPILRRLLDITRLDTLLVIEPEEQTSQDDQE